MNMIFADKLIQLRKKNGWSQEDLANEIGVSRQSVSKWESAQSVPDLNKVLKLSKIFNVSTDYLLKDEIEEPDEKKPEPVPAAEEKPVDEDAVTLSIGEVTDYFKRTNRTTILKSAAFAGLIIWPVSISLTPVNDMLSLAATITILLASIVILFVAYGMEKKYNALKVQPVDMEYGGAGIAEDILSKRGKTYIIMKRTGIVIVAAASMMAVSILTAGIIRNIATPGTQLNDALYFGILIAADILFAAGAALISFGRARLNNIYCLLEEGRFSRRNKKKNAGIRLFSLIYIGLYVLMTVIAFFINPTLGFVVLVVGLVAFAIIYAALVSSLIKKNKISKKP